MSEMRRGRRIAVDVGDARIGVASCDPDGVLATPVETVPGRDVPAAHRRLRAIVAEYEPLEVVVGLPRSPNGGEGPAAAKVRAFAQELARNIAPVGVRLVDERMSTVTATQGLRASGVRSKKGRSVVDQAAAVVILQSALETERSSGAPRERASKWSSDRGTVTFRAMCGVRTAARASRGGSDTASALPVRSAPPLGSRGSMTEYGRGYGSEPWHPEDPLYGEQGSSRGQAQQPPWDGQQAARYPQQQDPYAQQQYNGGWDGTQGGQLPYDPYDPYGQQPPVDPYSGTSPDYYATPDAYPPPQPQHLQQQAQQQQMQQQQQYQQPHPQQQGPYPPQAEPHYDEHDGPGDDWRADPEPREPEPEHAFFAGDGGDDDHDDNDPREARRAGRERRGKKNKRRSGTACLVVALVFAGAVGAVGYFGYDFFMAHFGSAPDYEGRGPARSRSTFRTVRRSRKWGRSSSARASSRAPEPLPRRPARTRRRTACSRGRTRCASRCRAPRPSN